MPPQSRGSPTDEAPSFSTRASDPPTLRPYLENLPPPNTLIADQRTPTGPSFDANGDRDLTTPTRLTRPLRFETVDDDDDDDEEEREEVEDGVTLDDDDFESHYSRHSSPASSTSSSSSSSASETEAAHGVKGQRTEEEDEVDDDEITDSPNSHYPRKPDNLQRISSLPTSQPLSHHQHQHHHHHHHHQSHHTSQLHTSQSTSSLPPAPPLPLYPPFYNRPPTPLPPSPSLTSLLRPPSLLNRSTTSTRPTTPDSSDVETPNDTEAAVAHSARRAHPLPPTSPKVPTYEYYGFVLYLTSSLAFLIYMLWSYLPSPFLHALGVTYYPNRWWSLAIPAWIVMALVFIYVALLSFNVEYLTLPMASLECMVDEAGNVAVLDEQGRVRKGGSKRFVSDMEGRSHRRSEEQKKKPRKGKATTRKKDRDRDRDRHNQHRNRNEISDQSEDQDQDQDQDQEQSQWYGYLGDYGDKRIDDLRWKYIWNEGTDAVMDVPIGGVCEVLYGGEW